MPRKISVRSIEHRNLEDLSGLKTKPEVKFEVVKVRKLGKVGGIPYDLIVVRPVLQTSKLNITEKSIWDLV